MKFLTDGVEVPVEWQEPSLNTDETALDDLHHTSVFYNIGAGPVNVVDLPANLATGGEVRSYSFLVPVLRGEQKNLTVWTTATDLTGQVSEPTAPITATLDRRVPKPPFGLRFGA